MTFAEQIELSQHLVGAAARRWGIVPAQHRADDAVCLDGEGRERPHQLEGAADAATADLVGRKSVNAVTGKGDRTAVGREYSGNDVEQRGLARAVRADDGEDRAALDTKADVIDRKQAAKALADRFDR